MGSLIQDLRYGIQSLIKQPGFTLIAVLTLALGVGANTALFSVVDAVLLKKLPVKNPNELVLFNASWVREKFSTGGFNGSNRVDPATGISTGTSFPLQTLNKLRQEPGVLSDVFAFAPIEVNLNAGGQAEVVSGQVVSGNYYSALGVPAVIGRTINDSDDNLSAPPVAVISHNFWTVRFGSDPSIVGRQVNINNVGFTIVGVSAAKFEGAGDVGSTSDVSIPISWEQQIAGERSNLRGAGTWWLRMMGRLKSGATLAQAQTELAGPFQQSILEHRAARQSRSQNPLRAVAASDYPKLGLQPGAQGEMMARNFYVEPLRLLFGIVALVLLIACANVANLLLVRASSRRKEIAVRIALGASRMRLIRQLLTESILLASLGAGLGILLALWLKNGLLAVTDWGGRFMSGLTPRIDLRVLAFTVALTFLTGIIFGLIPSLRATRVDLAPTLKDTGRSTSVVARSWLARSLVVFQVSVSVLLLIGAGLLLRSLHNLQNVETGFNAKNLLLFRVEPSLIGYRDDKLAALYEQIFARVEGVPGVLAVTASQHALLSRAGTNSSVFISGRVGPDGQPVEVNNSYILNVRENFFDAMEMPLLMGRALQSQDDARAPQVAVVNQTFAKTFFPNENPIGKRFGYEGSRAADVEIVGIVRDAKYTSQRNEIAPVAYHPWRQHLRSMSAAAIEVRTKGDPDAVIGNIRQAVREIDSNLPVSDIKTQIEQADETLAMERTLSKLLTLFGVIAQLLAAIGLYGVMAYSVSQRTQEIGIRMALGANRGRVLSMILKQGMVLTMVGVGFGLLGAYVLTKYLETLTTMLYGVKPRDPWTFGLIGGLLTLVALVACLVPARRATKVDPLEALRYE